MLKRSLDLLDGSAKMLELSAGSKDHQRGAPEPEEVPLRLRAAGRQVRERPADLSASPKTQNARLFEIETAAIPKR